MAFFARAPLLCAAFFAIAPLLCALDQNEIKITLYIHLAWAGPARNEVNVVGGSNKRFGEIHVNNWVLLDGPDPSSAKVIGHAQGLSMNTQPDIDGRSWHTSVNFVFNDESKYKGSTLQVLGLIRFPRNGVVREWSIVGGTGQFTMARGVAKYDMVKINADSYIIKVNVHAYYSSMDSTTVYTKSGWNTKISQPIAEKTIA